MNDLPMNAAVLSEVSHENVRQLMKWGVQHHERVTNVELIQETSAGYTFEVKILD